MKFYIIFTVVTNDDGETKITFFKDLYFFKSAAFERAKLLGEDACVYELQQTEAWNLNQIESEEM